MVDGFAISFAAICLTLYDILTIGLHAIPYSLSTLKPITCVLVSRACFACVRVLRRAQSIQYPVSVLCVASLTLRGSSLRSVITRLSSPLALHGIRCNIRYPQLLGAEYLRNSVEMVYIQLDSRRYTVYTWLVRDTTRDHSFHLRCDRCSH